MARRKSNGFQDDRPSQILDQLTLEEKLSLLGGANMWETNPIPRLRIGRIKTTDGPAGARGKTWTAGSKSAFVPCGPSLGATFSPDLLHQLGKLLAEETKDKRSHVLLAPTMNLHRSPLGGRVFENASEDPYLTGTLATAEIKGIQENGVAATMKHFVCSEQETRRFNIDVRIEQRTLREIYLRPFQMAVDGANPWALITSYNKINGKHADENEFLLKMILRKEWNWDGLTISDWGGTNSIAEGVQAGLDLEMPGPPARRKIDLLLATVRKGELEVEDVNRSVLRLLQLAAKVGVLDQDPDKQKDNEEVANDRPEHRKLLRRLCHEGMVLLKNDGILPLNPKELKKVAILGPNAMTPTAGGSGSAVVASHYMTTPFQSFINLTQEQNPDLEVRFAKGVLTHKLLPLLGEDVAVVGQGKGLKLEFYKGFGCQGEVVSVKIWETSQIFLMSDGDVPDDVVGKEYSFRCFGTYTPSVSGLHTFGISSVGKSKFYIDKFLLIDNTLWSKGGDTFMNCGSEEAKASMSLVAGTAYKLEVYQDATPPPLKPHDNTLFPFLSGLRIGCLPPIDEDGMIARAATLAKTSDVAIMVIGMNNDWEREGVDRSDIFLPRRTEELIEAVCNVNSRTVIVNQSGCAISMINWVHKPAAILQAWYQGQENGNALADVLLGFANPSGKLPITFAKSLTDYGSSEWFPGEVEKDLVEYGEGRTIGYRWFDEKMIEPLFEFGFGMSYTQFEVKIVSLEGKIEGNQNAVLKVAVRNIGKVEGAEVVQCYIDHGTGVKSLQDFQKVYLGPGQEKICILRLGKAAVEYFDNGIESWKIHNREVTAYVGTSSRKIVGKVKIEVNGF